jgi:hypothetical protein
MPVAKVVLPFDLNMRYAGNTLGVFAAVCELRLNPQYLNQIMLA